MSRAAASNQLQASKQSLGLFMSERDASPFSMHLRYLHSVAPLLSVACSLQTKKSLFQSVLCHGVSDISICTAFTCLKNLEATKNIATMMALLQKMWSKATHIYCIKQAGEGCPGSILSHLLGHVGLNHGQKSSCMSSAQWSRCQEQLATKFQLTEQSFFY